VTEPKVWVFFYGSYMNFGVLREVDLLPERWEVGQLNGFHIRIRPRANLIRSHRDSVYGIAATATHAELNRLYAHAQEVLGEVYFPEAVLVHLGSESWRVCLCYICPEMIPRQPEAVYVQRILEPAREFGFPSWYIERLESFLT
jgi:cation transport regulator ChaC